MKRVEVPKATRVQPQFVHGFFLLRLRKKACCFWSFINSLLQPFPSFPSGLRSFDIQTLFQDLLLPPSPLHRSQETCNVSVNAGLNRTFSNFHYTCRVCESGSRSFSSDLRSQRARQIWPSPHHVTQARDAPHRPTTDRFCSVAAILPFDTHHQRNSSRKIQ